MRVVLAEGDGEGAPATLDGSQAAAFESTGLVRLTPLDEHRWNLVPRGRVGAAAVGGHEVIVTPKVGIARLLFLLGYAQDPGFRPEDVEGVPDDDLWPAVAETLSRHGERAVLGGVLQSYITLDEALPLVRGRIRIGDQLARRPGMLLPIEVRYDEYSADIPENRILRSAVRRMLAVRRLSTAVRARLNHLDGRLDGVTPLVPGSALPQWRPSRLNQRDHAALRLAGLVLRHQSFEVGPGGLRVAAFVVDMAKVFEDFVGVALREEWRSWPGWTRQQYPISLDVGGAVRMRVDVVHLAGGRPHVVADAKYKLESDSGRYPNADHYQMLAYCTALRLRVGWLVYAQGSHGERRRRVRHSDVEIVEYPLDLDAAPADLLDEVARLSHRAQLATP